MENGIEDTLRKTEIFPSHPLSEAFEERYYGVVK